MIVDYLEVRSFTYSAVLRRVKSNFASMGKLRSFFVLAAGRGSTAVSKSISEFEVVLFVDESGTGFCDVDSPLPLKL